MAGGLEGWEHVEVAAVEEDGDAVGREGAEAAGGAFENLDLAVEPLSDGICDPVFGVGDEVVYVALEHPGDLAHRWQLAVRGAVEPLVKEATGTGRGAIAVQVVEQLLEPPGASDLELHRGQLSKGQ